ncbi:hypothetical protein INR49_028207, partial [Caranx melampygus]
PDPIFLGFSKECGSRSEFPQGSPDSWTVARDCVCVKLHQGHSQAQATVTVTRCRYWTTSMSYENTMRPHRQRTNLRPLSSYNPASPARKSNGRDWIPGWETKHGLRRFGDRGVCSLPFRLKKPILPPENKAKMKLLWVCVFLEMLLLSTAARDAKAEMRMEEAAASLLQTNRKTCQLSMWNPYGSRNTFALGPCEETCSSELEVSASVGVFHPQRQI